MARLTELLEKERLIILSGPYATETAERVARDITQHPQKASGVPHNKFIGAACSALLTEEGQVYLREIASDYLKSVPPEQALILVTPSFRLAKQNLESAATVRGVDPNLPRMGLELCLDAIQICLTALNDSGRSMDNTLLAMSIGPPFESYKGELVRRFGISGKYSPQTLAAIRFGHDLDYLMFETVSSLEGAIEAARAYKQAHEELNVPATLSDFVRVGTIAYQGDILSKVGLAGKEAVAKICPSYDTETNTFKKIKPTKDYLISLCLEADGTLNHVPLDMALTELYYTINAENLYEPIGIGINCNSTEVTTGALASLSKENLGRVIGIHPNASPENDPRKYGEMTSAQRIQVDIYAQIVTRLAQQYNIRIVGGCCGTNEKTMTELFRVLTNRS